MQIVTCKVEHAEHFNGACSEQYIPPATYEVTGLFAFTVRSTFVGRYIVSEIIAINDYYCHLKII